MTYEKAIDLLNDCYIRCDPCCVGSCEECISDAKQTAIEALEKQIPKKPKGDYDSVPHHRCPNCNGAIRVYCDDPYDPVCKFCGQAIDWSDDE